MTLLTLPFNLLQDTLCLVSMSLAPSYQDQRVLAVFTFANSNLPPPHTLRNLITWPPLSFNDLQMTRCVQVFIGYVFFLAFSYLNQRVLAVLAFANSKPPPPPTHTLRNLMTWHPFVVQRPPKDTLCSSFHSLRFLPCLFVSKSTCTCSFGICKFKIAPSPTHTLRNLITWLRLHICKFKIIPIPLWLLTYFIMETVLRFLLDRVTISVVHWGLYMLKYVP